MRVAKAQILEAGHATIARRVGSDTSAAAAHTAPRNGLQTAFRDPTTEAVEASAASGLMESKDENFVLPHILAAIQYQFATSGQQTHSVSILQFMFGNPNRILGYAVFRYTKNWMFSMIHTSIFSFVLGVKSRKIPYGCHHNPLLNTWINILTEVQYQCHLWTTNSQCGYLTNYVSDMLWLHKKTRHWTFFNGIFQILLFWSWIREWWLSGCCQLNWIFWY